VLGLAVGLPTLYLWVADAVAIARGSGRSRPSIPSGEPLRPPGGRGHLLPRDQRPLGVGGPPLHDPRAARAPGPNAAPLTPEPDDDASPAPARIRWSPPDRARAIPRPRSTGVGVGSFRVAGSPALAIGAWPSSWRDAEVDSEAPRRLARRSMRSSADVGRGHGPGRGPPGADADPLDHAEPIEMRVYASPTCGCCSLWVDHLEENGFEVETVHRDDMAEVKRSLRGGGPAGLLPHRDRERLPRGRARPRRSDIRRLLAEAPGRSGPGRAGDAHRLAGDGGGRPGRSLRRPPHRTDGSTGCSRSYGR
jgi:hypothetical protein